MMNLFYSFFVFLVRPFRCYEQVNFYKNAYNDDVVMPFNVGQKKFHFDLLSLAEGILVSWPFVMLNTIYTLITIKLGLETFEFFGEKSESFVQFLGIDQTFVTQKALLISSIVNAILYPVIIWVYMKLWQIMIDFFQDIFTDVSSAKRDEVEEVLSMSLASSVFLAIPVVGGVLKKLFFIIYLFAGLKKHLGYSTLQSILILLGPLFLIGLMIVLFLGMLLISINSI